MRSLRIAMFCYETVSATGMPADTDGFSFFCTGKFAAVKKNSLPSRKVVNGGTEAPLDAYRGSMDN